MGLAEHLRLSTREVRAYGIAGLLHDLGKVKVPVDPVQKPRALTPEEQAIMRHHPVDGARMILESDNRLDLCAAVAFEHHIMIDGGGYPSRHMRRDCHHASMLVHVCDVFDALRTHRPYRVAWETNAVLDYITQRTSTEFHPDVSRAFVTMLRERELREARADAIDGPAIAHSVPDSHVGDRQRSRRLAVDVGESISARDVGRDECLTGERQEIRVGGERVDRTTDELRALGVAEIEDAGAEDGFGPNEPRVERYHGHAVRAKLDRRVVRELVRGCLGDAVQGVADSFLRGPV
jgi:hypothetical protein